MSPRRLEARDLRSLDRASMRSIFRPLDPNDKPSPGSPRRYYDPALTPKDAIGSLLFLLMFPLLLALVSVELLLAVPQLVAWLSVLGFIVIYTAGSVLIIRRG